MIRDFTKEELEPADTSNAMEFTLGGGTLLTLAGGLVILCVVCFGLGYAVGHRGNADPAETTMASAAITKASIPKGSGTKPGASAVAPPQPQISERSDGTGDGPDRVATMPEASGASGSTQEAIKPALESQVHPALAAQGGATQPGSTLKIQPATVQSQGWMVQIAAISRSEDAQVLVDALKKRGYEVTARRDVGDNLIHVQTGPFVNRNDANAMRQKLLNDGYNAIVQ